MIASGIIKVTRILTLAEWPENTPEERAVKEEFRKVAAELREEVARRARRAC